LLHFVYSGGQYAAQNDADLSFKNLSETLTLRYTVYPKNAALKTTLSVFVLMTLNLVFFLFKEPGFFKPMY